MDGEALQRYSDFKRLMRYDAVDGHVDNEKSLSPGAKQLVEEDFAIGASSPTGGLRVTSAVADANVHA